MLEEVNNLDVDESVKLNSYEEIIDTSDLTTSTVTESNYIDYSDKLDDLSHLGVTMIFIIGILSGLIAGKILWDKVR